MTTRPVRITARQWVYLAKTVDMSEQDYETYLSICENCRDFNQDGRLRRRLVTVFQFQLNPSTPKPPVSHSKAIKSKSATIGVTYIKKTPYRALWCTSKSIYDDWLRTYFHFNLKNTQID